MGRELSQVRWDMELKILLRPIQVQEFEGWPSDRFTAAPGRRLSEGWKGMGPLAASTRAHKRCEHPSPRLSLGWFPVHGFFLEERQQALGTGRTDPRTIWTSRQESRVGHQLTYARPPQMGSYGPLFLCCNLIW